MGLGGVLAEQLDKTVLSFLILPSDDLVIDIW